MPPVALAERRGYGTGSSRFDYLREGGGGHSQRPTEKDFWSEDAALFDILARAKNWD